MSARALRSLVAFVIAIGTLLGSREAAAVGDPALDWWTVETSHFRIHYPRQLEPIADRVAKLAESIHGRLVGPMGNTPKTITHIVLTDDVDDANGSATALPRNTVRLFVTAPDDTSPLGDYDDWLLELVTHEYTHILHTDNISGIPAIVNSVLGKTLSPNQLQPRWILEGLATWSESRHSSAGRMRSSLFDMYLRADVLEDRIAGLDQLSSPALRWPQGNLWYLYGSRFLGWISQVYGPDTMRAVSVDYGSMVAPWQMNRAIRRVTGRTYEQLYDGFQDHLRRRYAAQMAEVERRGLREGTRVTDTGATVMYPAFVPPKARTRADQEELVFYRSDQDQRGGIYRMPIGPPRRGRSNKAELVARTNGTTMSSFTPTGDLVFNSSTPWKNVYSRYDLFVVPRGETSEGGEEEARRRLTYGARAEGADVSPDGSHIVFTVNDRGTTYLQLADLNADGGLVGRRTLVPSARFEQAYTPRYSPDGTKVAYSAWTRGGYRDIRIVDVATGTFAEVAHDRAMDTHPTWSPDGSVLYFASDRTKIFNIYALDFKTKELRQVTNVKTGAIQPAVSPDGKTLVYVGYRSRGYDLYSMPLDPARYLDAVPSPTDRPDPPSDPPQVEFQRNRYSPLPTLAPRSFSFALEPGTYGTSALTLSAVGSDVVGHHTIGASITFDPAAPEPVGSIDYTFSRLPVDMSLSAYHTVSPRTGYRFGGKDHDFDEVTNGISAGLSLPMSFSFSRHSFGFQYRAASFKGRLPVASIPFDPYSPQTRDPPQGFVGIMHLGYGYSDVEGSIATAGPARGVAFSAGFDYADDATGSEYSFRAFEASLSTYLPMPWPGHHTLAVRSAGALAGGTYSRNGVYFVGGYDLENVSLVDSVTTGAFDGAFVVRGYPARSFVGRQYLLYNMEYRVPVFAPDRGISTLPVFFRRIDANLFLDYGGAFNRLDLHATRLFHAGNVIDSPDMHAALGGELWFNVTFGYFLTTQLRLGYAHGFSAGAIEGGQLYFVAAGAF